ncbi:MAG TPA: hydroxyisourate hydrolase [Thermoanaerobaculia bacterium]|nr:hydroxyisourate hydrolase [Thermoanaerobaculia bacterium]
MAGITTHVLDTAKGRPAAGVPVTLRFEDEVVFEGVTDNDGRAKLVAESQRGTYRLTFANPGGFFPEITIVFRIEETAQHYHVPLLLAPFGYSTYRGS